MGLYLEEACKLKWWKGRYGKEEPQAYGQAPYKSVRLYACVPAPFEAHSAVYALS